MLVMTETENLALAAQIIEAGERERRELTTRIVSILAQLAVYRKALEHICDHACDPFAITEALGALRNQVLFFPPHDETKNKNRSANAEANNENEGQTKD